jgi:hypothetical protein
VLIINACHSKFNKKEESTTMNNKKVYGITWTFVFISAITLKISGEEKRQFITTDYAEYVEKLKNLTDENIHKLSGIQYIQAVQCYEGEITPVPQPEF